MDRETAIVNQGSSTLRVEVSDSIDLVLETGGAETARLSAPYPEAGYGGHDLVVSPKEAYIALFLYSGQSEVGYELFTLKPFAHLSRLPYVEGEGHAPVFAPDESAIALLSVVDPYPEGEEMEDDDETTLWAELRVQRLPGQQIDRLEIRTEPVEEGWEAEDAYPSELRFAADALVFSTPWESEVSVELPFDRALVIEGPGA